MKKLLLLLIIISIISGPLIAQDLIVTHQGDSINCKIKRIEKDFIDFTFKFNNEVKNSSIPKAQVVTYQKNHYTTGEVKTAESINHNDYKKLRFNAFGGLSRSIGKVSETVPTELHEYVNQLKSGGHFGCSMNYFFSENFGAGLRYAYFNSKSEFAEYIYITDPKTGNAKKGKLKDNINIHYFGPSFNTKTTSPNKMVHLITGVSLGYLNFTDYATRVDNYTLSSGTMALVVDFEVDMMVDKKLALGFGLSLTGGSLSKLEEKQGTTTNIIELDKDNRESVSRIDISVGLKFYK